jgi:superfamily I DNA/RNA helicase
VRQRANSVISRIGHNHRVQKEWGSTEREGLLKLQTNPYRNIDFLKDDWLILARTNYILDKVEEELKTRGIFYQRHNSKSVSDRLLLAINSWTKLTRNRSITLEGVKAMYHYMNVDTGVKYGFKTMPRANEDKEYTHEDLIDNHGLLLPQTMQWDVALDRISPTRLAYLLASLRRNQNLNHEAKVKLSTIHGSKGGEASNVLLFSQLSHRVDEGYRKNRDAERRVFYVGMTRAKNELHMVRSENDKEFSEMFWRV